MAKFYGVIGYAGSKEIRPGVWKDDIIEYPCYGELIRNTRRLESTDKSSDDINISNDFSIIADPYAQNNFHNMKYVEFMGTKWKISNVEVQYPRLILSVGGVYNGK